jgi:hypothetical protein
MEIIGSDETCIRNCLPIIILQLRRVAAHLKVLDGLDQIGSHEHDIVDEVEALKLMNRLDAIRLLLLSAAAKFADLFDGKVDGSRPDNKIQSPRSPWSAPIDEGLTRQMS